MAHRRVTPDDSIVAVPQEFAALRFRLRAIEAKLTDPRAKEALLQMAGFHLDDVERQFAPLIR